MACHKYSWLSYRHKHSQPLGNTAVFQIIMGEGKQSKLTRSMDSWNTQSAYAKLARFKRHPSSSYGFLRPDRCARAAKSIAHSSAKPSRQRAWAHLFVFPSYTHAICKWSHRIIRNTTFFFCMWLHLVVDKLLKTRSNFQKLKELAGYREGNKYYQEPPRSAPRISVLDGVAGTSFAQPHLHWLRHYNFPATPVTFSVFSLLQASVTNRGVCPRR